MGIFAIVSGFFKSKFDKTSMYFLLAIGALLAVFLVINSETILTKFGFETKTALKSELVITQGNLDKAVLTNKEMSDTIEKMKKDEAVKLAAIAELHKEKEVLKGKLDSALSKTDAKIGAKMKTLDSKTKVTADTVTIPLKESEEISNELITSLNEYYTATQVTAS